MNTEYPENNAANAKKFPVKLTVILISVIAIFTALGIGLYFMQANAVAAVISLDVNPSVELKINKSEKVLSCTPLNAEAAQVLFELDGGKDLEGAKIELAVNAVVGAFVKNGYSSVIMVSVEDSDKERASRLKEELADTVETVLKNENVSAEVISSEVMPEASLDSLAREYGISVGKAALIERIVKLNSSLDWGQLSLLSIGELEDLLEAGAPGMPIGAARAKELALGYAGPLIGNALAEVDCEIDDFPPHYEVELFNTGYYGEFKYKIDAYTGELISGMRDIATYVSATTTAAPVTEYPPVTTPWPFDYPENADEATSAAAVPERTETDTQPVTDETANTAAPSQSVAPEQTAVPAYIGDEAAKQAAFNHAGVSAADVSYVDCHIEYDDGYPECYEIEFICGDICYEYDIDLYSGSVHKCSHETHRHNGHCHGGAADVGNASVPAAGDDIGETAALSVALGHAGKTRERVYDLEIERDYENGWLEYEIEFKCDGMEYKYEINGYDGSVIEFETEIDD